MKWIDRLRRHCQAQRQRNAFDVRLHTSPAAGARAARPPTPRQVSPSPTASPRLPRLSPPPPQPAPYFQLDIPLARLRETQLQDLLAELPAPAQAEARDALKRGTAGVLDALDRVGARAANEQLRRWYLVALAYLADSRQRVA